MMSEVPGYLLMAFGIPCSHHSTPERQVRPLLGRGLQQQHLSTGCPEALAVGRGLTSLGRLREANGLSTSTSLLDAVPVSGDSILLCGVPRSISVAGIPSACMDTYSEMYAHVCVCACVRTHRSSGVQKAFEDEQNAQSSLCMLLQRHCLWPLYSRAL